MRLGATTPMPMFDWDARMILQGEDLPTHLGSLIMATKAVAKYLRGRCSPRRCDVSQRSRPTTAATCPTCACTSRCSMQDELLFWTVSKGHVIDAGGPVPGSYNSEAKEIYAEGLADPAGQDHRSGGASRGRDQPDLDRTCAPVRTSGET